MYHSLAQHNRKVEFLDALAILMRCDERIAKQLPDGCCPDVLRVNRRKNFVFMGDAKVTESPSQHQTQARLTRYLKWLSAHIQRPRATGVFAICFVEQGDRVAWVKTISFLAHEVGLNAMETGLTEFDRRCFVVWLLFSHQSG